MPSNRIDPDFPGLPLTDPVELANTIGTRTLDYVKQAQRVTLQAVEAWSGAVGHLVPDENPLLALVPDAPEPTQLVDKAFAFGGQLLAAQHTFARELITAAAPAAAQSTEDDA